MKHMKEMIKIGRRTDILLNHALVQKLRNIQIYVETAPFLTYLFMPSGT